MIKINTASKHSQQSQPLSAPTTVANLGSIKSFTEYNTNKYNIMAPASTGTFQPLRHRSGTMRERLHSYTQRTLGAGGSYNDAVRAINTV